MNQHWSWLVLIAWVAWWLWAAHWPTVWAVLRQGGWLALLLLMIVSALVWSQIAPSDFIGLRFLTVHNFWWQLVAVGLLMALTFFCGWLQRVFGWTPEVMSLEPVEVPVEAHGHAHH